MPFHLAPVVLADQTLPPMDGMYWLMLATRVLHILGAIILVGGLFYLRMIVNSAPASDKARSVDEIFAGSRGRWAMWVGIAALLLIATGLFNYFTFMQIYDEFDGPYHMLFGIKFLLGLGVIFIASLLAGRTAAADRFRQGIRGWLAAAIVLGIAILIIAAMMRTMPHVPKPDGDEDGAPPLVAPMNVPPAG
jgi:putative copper export protein